MEIPFYIRELYNHWQKHTLLNNFDIESVDLDFVVLKSMYKFANDRMNIWEKKINNQIPPFTDDPILNKYRFCNIYRELDRQTIEIHTQLKKLTNNFSLWLLNVAFQRFICNPATVIKLGLLNYSQENNKKIYKRLINLPKPKYGTAYVFPISVIQYSSFPSRELFFCYYLPIVIKDIAEIIIAFENKTVLDALDIILPKFGYNMRFHWTEILIDVAYQYPEKINLFEDFPVGPGALQTFKRLNKETDPIAIINRLVIERPFNFSGLTFQGKGVLLSAENWEGIGCEFRKYTNLKLGHGRVRKYNLNQ